MIKTYKVISSIRYESDLSFGSFPFIIHSNGKYDRKYSLTDVYMLYIKLLYEK